MAKDLKFFINKSLKTKNTSGNLIKSFRKSLNLTQGDVVEATKIKRPNLSALENDRIPMTNHYAEILAVCFGIHPSTLLYPDGEFSKNKELLEIEKRAKKIINKRQAV
ncbi:MAG: helix-turn-helix transcriptional regulator [Bdellovibrionales bacterium]|nr:helix-turn-helix transcriptional regulator [Bdellovibrionales bacterium]